MANYGVVIFETLYIAFMIAKVLNLLLKNPPKRSNLRGISIDVGPFHPIVPMKICSVKKMNLEPKL